MKKIELTGGLGNQMFQYAHGRQEEILGKKIKFIKNFSDNRKYSLGVFNIKSDAGFTDKKQNKLFKSIDKIKIYFNLYTNKYYLGEKYFQKITDQLRHEFTLKNPLTEKTTALKQDIIKSPVSVSIHIRRGDYVDNPKTNKYHGLCDLQYYCDAVNTVKEKIGGDFKIFIFSDDINWAKKNIKFPCEINFVFDSEITDYEEMYLMSLCKHNIIANSTFSWWGAWLNINPNKIVIAPKKWFNNKKVTQDIIPNNWIKI